MPRRPLLLLATLVAVPAALSASAAAPPLPASTPLRTWTTDWAVGAMLPAAGRVYLAGSFGAVGPAAGPLLALRTRDGSVDPAFTQFTGGDVKAVASDGRGGWFLGGDFAFAGGVRCSYLVHVGANGRLDRRWCPHPNGPVSLIARAGGTLYLGGSFTRVGETARTSLAAVRTKDGRATRWRPVVPPEASILALAVERGRVFVGGYFTSFGGRPVSGIAALDATTGRTLRWNARLDRSTCSTREPCVVPVGAIAVEGDSVYVAGRFDLVGGKRRIGLAALDPRTARSLSWRADVDREALIFAPEDVRLFASGRTVYVSWPFARIRATRTPGIAALDAHTGAVQPWHARLPLDAEISAFAVGRSAVVIAYFRDDAETYGVRSVDRTNGRAIAWTKTDFCCAGDFGTAITAGARVLITSSIDVRGRYAWHGLAAFDPSTKRMLPWRPRVNNDVDALAATSTTLYVAGAFTKVDGQRRNRLAAFDLRTGKLLPWNPDAAGEVSSIAVDGSSVYAAGRFTSIGGSPRNGLAAVDGTTGAVTSWDPQPSGEGGPEILAIAARGTTVYVAGQFSAIGGAARTNLAAVDAATGAATSWDPEIDRFVTTLALGPRTLFMAGDFSHVHGTERRGLAEVDLATGAPTPFDAKWDSFSDGGEPFALDLVGQLLFVGDRNIGSFGGTERSALATLDTASGHLLNWQPMSQYSFPHVFALAHDARHMYVGGELTLSGRNGFVAFAH